VLLELAAGDPERPADPGHRQALAVRVKPPSGEFIGGGSANSKDARRFLDREEVRYRRTDVGRGGVIGSVSRRLHSAMVGLTGCHGRCHQRCT
jgi:hypothetical protein